ncbi:esterase [Actinoplanes sp. NBRC 14428]|uniref:Trypsin n=1 Tax=Pseudosporangium ferrugineum TaxID=439699 RepID=A0A2T0S8X9_9ACTN|nr:trypsin-like serine protease [Pseudosporangium ferrugineum]PRY29885.1 trypsin [Pseudosporangium ferrugineum]BCJ50855.1 esterase [Actinoplanes sp. NBRC 14428]
MRRRTKSMLAAALLVPAVVTGLAINNIGTANAIANGELVPEGKYSFSVKLTMTGIPTADGGRRNSGCSGSLVAPEWVLTAGHCFRDFNNVRQNKPVADLTTATVGRTDLDNTDKGHDATVIAVRQAPNADVSLAKIDTPITDVRPIKISRYAPQVGQVVRLTGYGSVTGTNPVPEKHLRTGQMKVDSLTDSVTGMKGFAPQSDTTPCPYDSGGPFFVEAKKGPYLVAVVSNGPSCPHTQVESAARVDNLLDWVNETIRTVK